MLVCTVIAKFTSAIVGEKFTQSWMTFFTLCLTAFFIIADLCYMILLLNNTIIYI